MTPKDYALQKTDAMLEAFYNRFKHMLTKQEQEAIESRLKANKEVLENVR